MADSPLVSAVFPRGAHSPAHLAGVVNTLLLGHIGALLLRDIVALNSGDILACFHLIVLLTAPVSLGPADLVSEGETLRGVVGAALSLLNSAALDVADNLMDNLTILRALFLDLLANLFILSGADLARQVTALIRGSKRKNVR